MQRSIFYKDRWDKIILEYIIGRGARRVGKFKIFHK